MNKYELIENETGRIVQPGELIMSIHGVERVFVEVIDACATLCLYVRSKRKYIYCNCPASAFPNYAINQINRGFKMTQVTLDMLNKQTDTLNEIVSLMNDQRHFEIEQKDSGYALMSVGRKSQRNVFGGYGTKKQLHRLIEAYTLAIIMFKTGELKLK